MYLIWRLWFGLADFFLKRKLIFFDRAGSKFDKMNVIFWVFTMVRVLIFNRLQFLNRWHLHFKRASFQKRKHLYKFA